jgi:hypothetical protein
MRLPRMTTRRWMTAGAIVALSIVARPTPSSLDTRLDGTVCLPPQIQGDVEFVDPQNHRVELTIGSDDGLVQGFELYVFQADAPSRFLGKIRIISLNYDESVGQVLGAWNGLELLIRKGDKVSLYPW